MSIRNILLLIMVLCPSVWTYAQDIAYRPVTKTDRIERYESVVSALLTVENELANLDLTQRSRFEHYFQLDQLRDLLGSDAIDVESLRDVERGMYSIFNGKRVDSLPQLGIALTEYVNFLEIISSGDLESEFQRRLAILQQERNRPLPDTQLISRQLDWMIILDQIPDEVQEIQKRFSHPSIVVDANPDLFRPLLAEYKKDISKDEFSTNRIIGVPVSGTSHMSATISPQLIDNPDHATLRLQIDGTIDSPASQSRPDPQRAPLVGNVSVTLRSSGETSVNGSKDIYWNGSRLVADPATVECETNSELEDVSISRNYRRSNRGRIAQRVDNQIRKRAYGEVRKKSERANEEAAALAERQVAGELDSEVAQLLAEANEKIDEFYRQPLLQLGLLPVGSSLSASESIRIGFRGTHYGGIGAPETLPVQAVRGDVEVSMHESMCSNLWAGYLRGRHLTDRDLKNVHREIRGFVPAALRIGGNQPWSIRLDSESPLEARFRNGQIDLRMRMQSLTIEGQQWAVPFAVATSYRVITIEDMPRFERIDDVTFQWLAARPDSKTEGMLKEFALKKFRAFFAKQMHMDGMSAPVGGAWGSTADMKIIDSHLEDGWWRIVFLTREMNRLE